MAQVHDKAPILRSFCDLGRGLHWRRGMDPAVALRIRNAFDILFE